jgi:hypothetical protein
MVRFPLESLAVLYYINPMLFHTSSGTANLIIIDVRYPLSTVFSTSLLLENR